MTSDRLQQLNATLRDRIEQVLKMHPELRDGTEAMALNRDLHVRVGASFPKRTQVKLQQRAKAIINRCPELKHYFDDLTSAEWIREITPHEAKLTAALDANVALRIQAERLIAAYIAAESDRAAIINELISLFDGPQQREAQRLAAEALGGRLAGASHIVR